VVHDTEEPEKLNILVANLNLYSKLLEITNQETWWVLLIKKTRGKKSHATVLLKGQWRKIFSLQQTNFAKKVPNVGYLEEFEYILKTALNHKSRDLVGSFLKKIRDKNLTLLSLSPVFLWVAFSVCFSPPKSIVHEASKNICFTLHIIYKLRRGWDASNNVVYLSIFFSSTPAE
jgi:hypothetical protein